MKLFQFSLFIFATTAFLTQAVWSMEEDKSKNVVQRYKPPRGQKQSYDPRQYKSAFDFFYITTGGEFTDENALIFWRGLYPHMFETKEFQDKLSHALDGAILQHSGCITGVPRSQQELEGDILLYIEALALDLLSPLIRMDTLGSVIKSGNVKAVKNLTEKLLNYNETELRNYVQIMKENGAQYETPIFWLPLIVTRWNEEKVPDENYMEIARYLSGILCPIGITEWYGKTVTQEEYIQKVNRWKYEENQRLFKKLKIKDMHQLPLDYTYPYLTDV